MYETRNAHEAARSIPLSRQGLLKSLDSLEHELGVPLFHDKSAPVCVPTRYGDAFSAYAAQQEKERHGLAQEFKRIDIGERGIISLGAAIGTMGCLGLDMLKEFELGHPQARIVRDEVPDLRCDEGLSSGMYSLALNVYPYHQDFQTMELYSVNRSVWVSVKDPLAREEALRIEDLQGYHVGVVGYTFKNYAELVTARDSHGVSFASLDTFSEMIHLYRYAMRPGFASFTVPSVANLFSGLFADSDALVRSVPIEGFPWKFGIAWHRRHCLNDLERAFVDHCVVYAADVS